MKTRNIQISLIAILAFISLNVSAVSIGNNKNKKALHSISFTNDLNRARRYFENWMIELKEINKDTKILPEEDFKIESWMTTEICDTKVNDNFKDQNNNPDICLINSLKLKKEVKTSEFEPEIESWMYE